MKGRVIMATTATAQGLWRRREAGRITARRLEGLDWEEVLLRAEGWVNGFSWAVIVLALLYFSAVLTPLVLP
ncbi:MAG TPA: hypothetical protein PLW40_09820 [Syntrophales bacterium]|nr:hypothetical protein [Syntrophales bacterium]HOM07969.1 hypothetical protein [Syntrophales bacterium]